MTVAGCGYSLAGRGSFLPTYLRVIAVPQFVNGTTVFDIDRRVTERVRSELIGRNSRYKIEPAETPATDAVLSGEITAITLTPVAFNQQVATRYVLTMTARVEFREVRTQKILWSNPSVQFREEFEPTTGALITDAQAYFGQDLNAQERIANEFARSVVSALMEAF